MKPSILLLLGFLGSCRALDTEEGDKSGETEGSGTLPDDCTPSEEVPYDGIDQDCDGSDLVDVDGDGQDGSEVGGDDCDDGDPATHSGANETPYDGIDQDCDGSDLIDVDGDGHAGTEAGGDDCLDSDAGAYPGAAEERENGVDDDCDGYADEVVVCLDGSGDFESIQDAVNDAPDGGTVVLCPGEYQEAVQVKDKDITIVGNPADPDQVNWTGEVDGSQLAARDNSALTLDGVALWGDVPTVNMVTSDETSSLVIRHCSFTGDLESSQAIWAIGSYGSDASVRYSRFEAADISLASSAEIVGNRLVASRVRLDGGGTTRVANNIWAGGYWSEITLGVSGLDSEFIIENNTLSTLSEFSGIDSTQYPDETDSVVTVRNNIFVSVMSWNEISRALWIVIAPPYGYVECNPEDYWPMTTLIWNTNLAYATPEVGASGDCPCSSLEESDECFADGALLAVSTILTNGITEADPLFANDGPLGVLTPGVGSPLIDAGTGDPDPDGSPNDIGASGGPDGDWYKEYPWPQN